MGVKILLCAFHLPLLEGQLQTTNLTVNGTAQLEHQESPTDSNGSRSLLSASLYEV